MVYEERSGRRREGGGPQMRCNGCALMPHLVHHVGKKCIVQPKIFKRVNSKYLEGHLFQALPEHKSYSCPKRPWQGNWVFTAIFVYKALALLNAWCPKLFMHIHIYNIYALNCWQKQCTLVVKRIAPRFFSLLLNCSVDFDARILPRAILLPRVQ